MDSNALTYTDENLLGQRITLTNCDREPIHIPGSIQPYGFLLCLDEAGKRVVQASANTAQLVGLTAEALLGGGLDQLLGPVHLALVEAELPKLTATPRLLGVRLHHSIGQPYYKLLLHRFDNLTWAEFEPVMADQPLSLDLTSLNTTLSQLIESPSLIEFYQVTVEEVRRITGFDRVMMYRFAADESGEVVAEARDETLEPYLGLHYPATDIPQQARLMYLKSQLRFLADVNYAPTPLVPVRNPQSGRPPDMTHATLRSVSPIHLEYLRNMGVAASMSISLVLDGRLWGMILCHHRTPRLVGYELRDLCVFVAKTFTALLRGKIEREDDGYQLRIRENQVRLFDRFTDQSNYIAELHQHTPTVMDLFDCGGAAICFEGEIIMLGTTPTKPQIQALVRWMQANVAVDVFSTTSYAALNPEGLALQAKASGILAISLAKQPSDYIFWFRPELLQTVTWAGHLQKTEVLQDGQLHLTPRQSFEAWKQSVENTSAAWKLIEIQAAREIRLHISDIRLKIFDELQARALTLSNLNTELKRSNDELDSFAYVASHDLKEPLRGIHNYSLFLLEDYADRLDTEGVSKLQTLVRLSQRMESLIESLLQISRVGRQDIVISEYNLNVLVAEVIDLLAPRLEQTGTTLSVPQPLPTLRCDPVRLREVYNNLLTNAMRYNDKFEKHVEIGVVPTDMLSPKGLVSSKDFSIMYVKDNGIGIDSRHHESIFRIFKRLHSQDKYGGGTGIGLAIVKKMVEKHDGDLWIDSTPGHGTTFYFTISNAL